MPPKAVQRTKEQKLAAALAGTRKGKKKKWSKGRVREKKKTMQSYFIQKPMRQQ